MVGCGFILLSTFRKLVLVVGYFWYRLRFCFFLWVFWEEEAGMAAYDE